MVTMDGEFQWDKDVDKKQGVVDAIRGPGGGVVGAVQTGCELCLVCQSRPNSSVTFGPARPDFYANSCSLQIETISEQAILYPTNLPLPP